MSLRSIFRVCLLVVLLCSLSYAKTLSTHPVSSTNKVAALNTDTIVSFDLDETLVESNHLGKAELKKAKELGYEIKKTVNGQDYIIRPGAIDLLEFAKSQGLTMMLFTHNTRDYAEDILESSGLAKYFTKIKAHEDVLKPYNVDFTKYPHHRNISYPQKSILETYTVDLYEGLIVTNFQRMQGECNIHPFMPCINCAKYPPLYGARVHIDNSEVHIDKPLDFVGIGLDDFYADRLETKDANGRYLWAETIKNDLLYLKLHNWIELYKQKYKKEPIVDAVEIVD